MGRFPLAWDVEALILPDQSELPTGRGSAKTPMRLKPAIVLLPLLLGTWGTTNYHMTCWFQQKPKEWYVKRTMWFRMKTLGIPLGSPDEVLEAWIRNHPDCCFVKPTELDPIKRILHGSNLQVMIFYRTISPMRENRPFATIDGHSLLAGLCWREQAAQSLRRSRQSSPTTPSAPASSNGDCGYDL